MKNKLIDSKEIEAAKNLIDKLKTKVFSKEGFRETAQLLIPITVNLWSYQVNKVLSSGYKRTLPLTSSQIDKNAWARLNAALKKRYSDKDYASKYNPFRDVRFSSTGMTLTGKVETVRRLFRNDKRVTKMTYHNYKNKKGENDFHLRVTINYPSLGAKTYIVNRGFPAIPKGTKYRDWFANHDNSQKIANAMYFFQDKPKAYAGNSIYKNKMAIRPGVYPAVVDASDMVAKAFRIFSYTVNKRKPKYRPLIAKILTDRIKGKK
ncbi:hypothetical protein [Psittacicella hinzii]|uniref:Uncharacterized protein n=1 Tax=Psittacicella hinzii TaxID=2028575 RepID=A0A3A1YPE7_9GAMM|nr:hypothetical protein [Psittacicella hinzii]RIY39485.1 hypothetical protein CKF58_02150 [Psittacicella hinzii]